MKLEDLKAALEERKFEGYLFERPARQIALEVRRKAGSIEEKYKAQDIQAISAGLFVILMTYFWFDRWAPWWSNFGVGLAGMGVLLQMACVARLYLPGRRICFDLPREAFLAEERKRLRARIRILGHEVWWGFIPMIVGASLWIGRHLKSIAEFASFAGMLAALCGAAWWISYKRQEEDLRDLLREIEQELAQIGPSGAA
jgi:hypothetical protein